MNYSWSRCSVWAAFFRLFSFFQFWCPCIHIHCTHSSRQWIIGISQSVNYVRLKRSVNQFSPEWKQREEWYWRLLGDPWHCLQVPFAGNLPIPWPAALRSNVRIKKKPYLKIVIQKWNYSAYVSLSIYFILRVRACKLAFTVEDSLRASCPSLSRIMVERLGEHHVTLSYFMYTSCQHHSCVKMTIKTRHSIEPRTRLSIEPSIFTKIFMEKRTGKIYTM